MTIFIFLVLVLMVVVVLLILVFVMFIARDLRAIRSEFLPDILSKLPEDGYSVQAAGLQQYAYPASSCHTRHSGRFIIWQWTAGQWRPELNLLVQGATLGQPPAYPGAFDGDCAKTWISDPEQ